MIEYLVTDPHLRVTCSASSSYGMSLPNGTLVTLDAFSPAARRRVCAGPEAADPGPGRWVNRSHFCSAPLDEKGNGHDWTGESVGQHDADQLTSPSERLQGSHCDFADSGDAWIWAPAACRLRRLSPLEAQLCLEEPGRRIIVGDSSPQRTLFFDMADIVLPGEVLKYKAHQDLEFPPVCFFHWVPYYTDAISGCPFDCALDYENVTTHIDQVRPAPRPVPLCTHLNTSPPQSERRHSCA